MNSLHVILGLAILGDIWLVYELTKSIVKWLKKEKEEILRDEQ